MALDRLKDNLWIRQSFMLPKSSIDESMMRRRLLTTASFKFTDTTLGGSFTINAPPSYSRFADPRMGGRLGSGSENVPEVAFMHSTGRFQVVSDGKRDEIYEDEIENQMVSRSSGQGAYYSEAIDDNTQVAVMRFGDPAFNSLTTFMGQFYSPAAAQFARTGRATNSGPDGIISSLIIGGSETAGSLLGGMLALPFQPLIMLGSFARFLSAAPPSKYYYLKPNMFAYWAAVQNIVNSIGVNLGIVPQALTKGQKTIYGDSADEFGPETYEAYHKALPDIISPSGYIDVFAMATKAQRRANRYNARLMDKMEKSVDSFFGLKQAIAETRKEFSEEPLTAIGGKYEGSMFGDYINRFASVDWFQPTYQTGAPSEGGNTNDAASLTEAVEPIGDRSQYNEGSNFWKLVEGELRDGANFISFKVDGSATVQESFSNEVGESGISQKVNSMSSNARRARFDLADGNIGFGVGTVVDAVRGFATSALDQLQLSGLAALVGSAFVDFPHVWQSAIAQMPSSSFTIQLRSPYANRLAQMQNLYIPLAMILAGGLPKMTGKRSYTQPFLCELYCKGRSNIRMGIIDSITIERGTGNVGWNQDGRALGIDVTFSVKDLSTIMAMPITTQFTAAEKVVGLLGEAVGGDAGRAVSEIFVKSMFDDDNAFTDYMATLGGLGFQDLVYAGRRWRQKRIRFQRAVEEMKSPAMWASFMVNATIPGRIANALALDTDRPATGR